MKTHVLNHNVTKVQIPHGFSVHRMGGEEQRRAQTPGESHSETGTEPEEQDTNEGVGSDVPHVEPGRPEAMQIPVKPKTQDGQGTVGLVGFRVIEGEPPEIIAEDI